MEPSALVANAARLIRAHPGLRLLPSAADGLVLEGTIAFARASSAHPATVADRFEVRITVLEDFPQSLPIVEEVGGRIPRDADHHVMGDGALCLENPMRIRLFLVANAELAAFVEEFVVPYLFGLSIKLSGGTIPQGELAHGLPGLIEGGQAIFGLGDRGRVLDAYRLLGMHPRDANKRPCPCGCARRLGRCVFRFTLCVLRLQIGRRWAAEFWLGTVVPRLPTVGVKRRLAL